MQLRVRRELERRREGGVGWGSQVGLSGRGVMSAGKERKERAR